MALFWVLRRWFCLLGAMCCIGTAQADNVMIVASDRSNASQAEVAQALLAELRRLGMRDVVQRDLKDLEAADFSGSAAPKVVVSLGVNALKQVLARDMRVPVIAAFVPRLSFDAAVKQVSGKASTWVCALYLDQPIGRQLELVRLALPGARRMGVLWGPESVVQRPALLAAARTQGLQEVPAHFADSGTLFNALQTALDDAQVLLAWPDPQVYNSATIANILLTTYRARVPVVGFSPSYVQAGALMSVHSTPKQHSQQAAAMAHAALQAGAPVPSQYPSDFEVSVNLRVARALGLTLNAADLSDQLRKLERRP